MVDSELHLIYGTLEHTMKSKKRILILISGIVSRHDKNWTLFYESLTKAIDTSDVEIVMGELSSLTFETDGITDKVYDRARGFSLDEFDFVVFRIVRKLYGRASACASFLQARNIPYIDAGVQPGSWSKYSAQLVLQSAGIEGIPSIYASNVELIHMIERNQVPFEYPLIIKDVQGKKGRLNFIASTPERAREILIENPETEFIVQKCIPNDGDYRVLVIGGLVKMVIYRQASSGSHLNNTSQGAAAEVVDPGQFSDEVLRDVIKAAHLQQLEAAGVDLMFDNQTGKHYIIEVNSSPQLATGAFPKQKMAAYAEYLVSRVHTKI